MDTYYFIIIRWFNENVHNRACHFFLGVGLSAPTTAVQEDTGLVLPTCRVTRQYARITQMSLYRINHNFFIWASGRTTTRTRGRPGGFHTMMTYFIIIANNEPQNNITSLQDEVSDVVRQQFLHDWEMELNRVHAKKGHGLNKLRTV